MYNVYFSDKLKETKRLEDKIKGKENDLNNRVNNNSLQVKGDKLQSLVSKIPSYRRDEVFEMLNLRVKSWAWKSKDKCVVIEGDFSVSENAW